ncbi:protein of unknown function [Polaribacter sp. KT25b]|uniref:3-keto-disaccharide hydrolase n=1 Tax=Polaribacter sp. KT25b TaxID=1855336 RepID=UPI000879F6EE|nr:DUF1080 domain-containing protein [Polaribacter sp. KT25b]SDR74672.1 protein of unknown function [Polaribacter sp. KT25b]
MLKLKIILSLITIISLNSCTSNTAKKNNKWVYLFNGKDLNGWVTKINHHKLGDNFANTFRVVNGAIQINYNEYSEFNERFGHLYYEKPFSSYHLKFEYRFTDQWMEDAPHNTYRNSGIMIHSQNPNSILKDQNWPISIEYQILAERKEKESRPTGNMCSPGTEVFFKGEMEPKHCISSSSKTYKWNQWISGEVIVYKDSLIQHIVENHKVLEYTKPQIGGKIVKGYDKHVKIDGKPLKEGFIALQAEGQGIEFREIKIKNLN